MLECLCADSTVHINPTKTLNKKFYDLPTFPLMTDNPLHRLAPEPLFSLIVSVTQSNSESGFINTDHHNRSLKCTHIK